MRPYKIEQTGQWIDLDQIWMICAPYYNELHKTLEIHYDLKSKDSNGFLCFELSNKQEMLLDEAGLLPWSNINDITDSIYMNKAYEALVKEVYEPLVKAWKGENNGSK